MATRFCSSCLSIHGVIGTAVLAGIVGNNDGQWIGRQGGLALVRRYGRALNVDESRLGRAHACDERHGAKAVFLGRFVALVRRCRNVRLSLLVTFWTERSSTPIVVSALQRSRSLRS